MRVAVEQVPQSFFIFDVFEPFDRFFVMEEHRIEVFNGELRVTQERSENPFHPLRVLFGYPLEGHERDLWVLYIPP